MSYLSTVLADSPQAFWLLQDLGATMVDSSPNALNGTYNGVVTRGVATGFAGLPSGVTFAGAISSYCSVPSTAALNLTTNMTYECWINYSAATGTLMSKGQQDGTHAGPIEYIAGASSISIDHGLIAQGFRPGTGPASGAWHYLVWTKNGNNCVLYVDGASVNTGTFTSAPLETTSQPFTLGGFSNAGVISIAYGGSMAAAAVYNFDLSAGQVTNHWNARNSPTPTSSGSTGTWLPNAAGRIWSS